MSKGLEALTKLKNIDWFCPKNRKDTLYTFYKNDFDVIETELKDYELMKQMRIIVADKSISDDDFEKLKNQRIFMGNLEQCKLKPLFDEETQNKLKVLEIIKEKKNNGRFLLKTNNLEHYNNVAEFMEYDKLTQEEFDLLKEVLK